MPFVYLHAVAFARWMLFVESDPWPKLTLIVSLEAIFLSTFVMIGQNRQAEFQRAKADHDFASEDRNSTWVRRAATIVNGSAGGLNRRPILRVWRSSGSRSTPRRCET
jgi:hypothetical protein